MCGSISFYFSSSGVNNRKKVVEGKYWPKTGGGDCSLAQFLILFGVSQQYRRIFGERTLSSSSQSVWPPSWIFKEEEGWVPRKRNFW